MQLKKEIKRRKKRVIFNYTHFLGQCLKKIYDKEDIDSVANMLYTCYMQIGDLAKANKILLDPRNEQNPDLKQQKFGYYLNNFMFDKAQGLNLQLTDDETSVLNTTYDSKACKSNLKQSTCVALSIAESVDRNNPYLTFKWEFSDGSIKRGLHVENCHDDSNNNTITYKVHAIDKQTNQIDSNVVVGDYSLPLNTYFDYPAFEELHADQEFNYTAHNIDENALSIWLWGDNTYSFGQSVNHVYEGPGEYKVHHLSIKDGKLISCTESIMYVQRKFLRR